MLLIVLAGHSSFLKVSKSYSPILKLNCSSGSVAVLFWGFLLPVATAGFSEFFGKTRFLLSTLVQEQIVDSESLARNIPF